MLKSCCFCKSSSKHPICIIWPIHPNFFSFWKYFLQWSPGCAVFCLLLLFAQYNHEKYRSSHPEVFLGKGILKIYTKFTGGHPCCSAILIQLQINFIEIALRNVCPLVNLLHIFRTPFLKNTTGWVLLKFWITIRVSCQFLRKIS